METVISITFDSQGLRIEYKSVTTRTHRDSSASFDIVALNPFRFSSEYYDSELDLVYYNYRHYSPSLGRFLSRDPIEEQGGLNLYAFVRNMPATEIDYLGRWLGGMHRQLTYGALSRIRLFIGSISSGRFLLITSRLKDVLIEKIVDANVATDSGDYKNKQNYHYCADRIEGWTTDYAKKFYTETLA